jgi:hypothetical protein
LPPRDIGIFVPDFIANISKGFSNDLKLTNAGIPHHGMLGKYFKIHLASIVLDGKLWAYG